MATTDELLDAVDEVLSDGVRRGMPHDHMEDDALDGRHLTIHGRRMVNFGSCSYLGLEMHPALKAGVHDAVDRFGTQFSSSRGYASAPLYRAAEEELANSTFDLNVDVLAHLAETVPSGNRPTPRPGR